MAITCETSVRVVGANGQEELVPLSEFETGVPTETWNEVADLRETEELDLGGGVTADRITSFTMETPNGSQIRFQFNFS